MATKIEASAILEILGRPKEHVTEALKTILSQIESEKGINLISKTAHEPKPLEKTDLFTSFAELDLEMDSFMHYFSFIFRYMPSNIQITYPEKLAVTNSELNEFGNALVQRLHKYDSLTKNAVAQRDLYAKELKKVNPGFFKEPAASKPKKEESSPKSSKKKAKKKSG